MGGFLRHRRLQALVSLCDVIMFDEKTFFIFNNFYKGVTFFVSKKTQFVCYIVRDLFLV